jgi:hypothetical protein
MALAMSDADDCWPPHDGRPASALGPFQYPEAPKVWPRPRLLASTATPARFIDFSIAPDAETAEKQVAEAHDISDSPRDRLVSIREDW